MKTFAKIFFTLLIANFSLTISNAQNTAITDDSGYSPNSSAMLDVKSTNKGVLMPRLTTAQRNLVSNPAIGLLVFDTDENNFYFYNGTAWINVSSGNSNDVIGKTSPDKVYLKDVNSNFGIGTTTPTNKLEVKADASNGIDQAIFNVVNNDGDTVFAVYPQGVRINVYDDPLAKAVSKKGGFAVGGFKPAKGTMTNEYLRITPDSIRMYIEENNNVKAASKKGGFAVGGFKPAKGTIINDYLTVNSDSINVSKSLYIPRFTNTERDNLGFTPSEALIIFNTSDKCMQIYENSVWSNIWCFNCAPSVLIQPVDNTICSGSNASFNVSATGTNLVYQWQHSSDGEFSWNDLAEISGSPSYSGVKTSLLDISNIPGGFTGNKYRCHITSSCEPGVNSNSAGLYFGSPSTTISIQPIDKQLSTNCSAILSVLALENGLQYQWQESLNSGTTWNNIIDGGTSPAFTGVTSQNLNILNAPSTVDGNKYRCVINNLCGTGAISNEILLSALKPIANTPTSVDNNSFTANWMHISATSNYFLDVSTSPDFSTFVPGFNSLNVGMSLSYSVTGLNSGITYYYRVRAAFTCGESLNSNIIDVTTM